MWNEQHNLKPTQLLEKEFQSNVKIIGEVTPLNKASKENYFQTLSFHPNAKSFIPSISNSLMKTTSIENKLKINPIKVYAEGQTIGIIDQNKNAWIISEIFQYPVNLSNLLKKRVTQMFLNEKQTILKTKKGLILINWGNKKLLNNDKLTKIPIYDSKSYYQHFFEAFSILDGSPDDIFYISNIKKSENSNKLYRIVNDGTQIHGYPTLDKFTGFQSKIIGLSVSKYHTLCWDNHGSIYSWGSRTLALGFENLPDEDLITQPTRLNFNFLVKTAFASNQYSLALSSDGKLYQWGIKKQVNEINEELIFQPRVLPFRYFNCQNQKFTTLKGKNEKFGVISTTGEMYVWGQKTRIFIHPDAPIPKQWQNDRLYQPYLVQFPPEQKIIDFIIEQNYLCLVLIPKQCKYHMKQQTQYWNAVINNVRNKFQLRKFKKIQTQANRQIKKKTIRVMTQGAQNYTRFNNRRQSPSKRQLTCRTLLKSQCTYRPVVKTSRDDWVSKAQLTKKSKQKYLQMARSQENLFNYIMKPVTIQKSFQTYQSEIPKTQSKKLNPAAELTINLIQNTLHIKSRLQTQKTSYDYVSSQRKASSPSFPDYFKGFNFQQAQSIKNKKKTQNKYLFNRTSLEAFSKRLDKKTYNAKLQQVLEKKKKLQIQNFNITLKKLQENSLQHRMKRHQELKMQKQHQQNREMIKNTIGKYLIKSYLVKMFGAPLGKGRDIKIANFARSLKFQRIQKNIRKIFTKAKVNFAMKKLKQLNFSRFVLVSMVFKRYVKRFRLRKYCQNRQIIVEELTKHFMKDKIKLGLSTSNMNIRKIQKFREWLILVKNERIKCLKFLWRIKLLGLMKINPDYQNMVVCHLPKNLEQITFSALYNQKVQQNPNLKLSIFLNKSPLFKIKLKYFKTVANLFTDEKKPLHGSQNTMNVNLEQKKRAKIKYFDEEGEDEKQPSHKLNLMNIDLYPYSLHYSIFSRPKNFDIALIQSIRRSQKWIKQQKLILQKVLRQIISKHERTYLRKSLQYDIELGHFIRDRYQMFSEKRWKCIIEYNQIERTISKEKKLKQLYRIMDLIGMKKILEHDCLPEKQLILEEALKRKDAPKPPIQYISFGQKEFKQAFRMYYDLINIKAKQLRKIA